MKRIAVLAVHPDDETLGAGGTLFRLKKEGADIFWIIMTEMTEKAGFSRERIKEREKEIGGVSGKYMFSDVFRMGFPTTELDALPMREMISSFGNILDKAKPELLILPFMGDVHSDHKKGFEAAFSCTKVFRYPFLKKTVMMETLSETDFGPSVSFSPNMYVDISAHIEDKIGAMELYKGEMKEPPFPRSRENVYALASLRGSQAGVKYAEAFMTLKEII